MGGLVPGIGDDWLLVAVRWLAVATVWVTVGMAVNVVIAMLVGYQGTEWRTEHRLLWGDVDAEMGATRPGVDDWPMSTRFVRDRLERLGRSGSPYG